MIAIIGAGLAGLSTAYHLNYIGKEYELYEQDKRVGGLCKSENIDGFIFDYTGHLLHIDNKYMKKLIKKLLKDNLKLHQRKSWIYSKGVYTFYPFQRNTYGLPFSVKKECLLGLIKASFNRRFNKKPIRTFEDWILINFGYGIAKHFMIPYNRKLWILPPKKIGVEWIQNFVPNTSIKEFIIGAFFPAKKTIGYNATFLYPQKGGIQALPEAFLRYVKKNLNLNKKLTEIDIQKKKIKFRDGETVDYETLISTMPLPELINCIKKVPKTIKNVVQHLKYVSVFNINFGINRKNITDKHWVYFPERKFIFYRIGFPHNFSQNMAPKGCSSIYTEIAYSPHRPINKLDCKYKVIKDLIKIKIIKNKDEIILTKALDLKYAYVVYDHYWSQSTKMIHEFLQKNNIFSIGRFGKWVYSDMEGALLDGKKVADKLAGI